VDRHISPQEWEDYLITGLLPQSATFEGHTSGATVDLVSEGGFYLPCCTLQGIDGQCITNDSLWS
jgi:hypothetical protein